MSVRYFDEEDETNNSGALEYIPAPGSPSYKAPAKAGGSDSEDDDPLDAFMAGIETQVNSLNIKLHTIH